MLHVECSGDTSDPSGIEPFVNRLLETVDKHMDVTSSKKKKAGAKDVCEGTDQLRDSARHLVECILSMTITHGEMNKACHLLHVEKQRLSDEMHVLSLKKDARSARIQKKINACSDKISDILLVLEAVENTREKTSRHRWA